MKPAQHTLFLFVGAIAVSTLHLLVLKYLLNVEVNDAETYIIGVVSVMTAHFAFPYRD